MYMTISVILTDFLHPFGIVDTLIVAVYMSVHLDRFTDDHFFNINFYRQMFMCFQEEWLMKLTVPPRGMTCLQCLPNEILLRFFLISGPSLTYPFTVLCQKF